MPEDTGSARNADRGKKVDILAVDGNQIEHIPAVRRVQFGLETDASLPGTMIRCG